MKKQNPLKFILYILFITLTFFSCSSNDEKIEPKQNIENKYFVSLDLAKKISNNINFNSEISKTNSLNKEVDEIFPVIDENNNTVYYIINFHEGGYLILAADKRSIPILGFSEENNFPTDLNDYPSELVEWLEFAKNQIKQIRDEKLEQPEEFIEEWNNYNDLIYIEKGNVKSKNQNQANTSLTCTPSFQQIGPLLAINWNQTFGYNDLMPTASQIGCSTMPYSNNKAYAGCVPIAIAQVMKYHNYPTNFDWNAMPNDSGSPTTSQLILDIHQKIINAPNSVSNPNPLSYNCDGTSVSSSYNVGNLFKNKFGYSSAQYNIILQMTHPARIKSEITQNRPVILDGGRKSGWWVFAARKDGHMWVCDGFTEEVKCVTLGFPKITIPYTTTRFRMNWGWGGPLNGYYTYGNFNPLSYDFNYQIGVLYNIKP